MLSKLTPGDRAAIAGATGYHLSPTGAVTNASGAVPPWSFIMAFAASRTAQPVEEPPRTAADDGHHVEVGCAGTPTTGAPHLTSLRPGGAGHGPVSGWKHRPAGR